VAIGALLATAAATTWDSGRGAWLDLGDEFQVNTYTRKSQYDPDVGVAAGTGASVAVWTSWKQDGSGSGVYGQRFSAAGAKVGSEFLVPTETKSSQYDSHVAVNRKGDFVVVWSSNHRSDGGRRGVFAQRFHANGTKAGGEFRVHGETRGYHNEADVATTDSGAFVVTWTAFASSGGSKANVYAQCYTSGARAVGGPFLVRCAQRRLGALGLLPRGARMLRRNVRAAAAAAAAAGGGGGRRSTSTRRARSTCPRSPWPPTAPSWSSGRAIASSRPPTSSTGGATRPTAPPWATSSA
jgi:hypothetical protein